MNNFYYASYTTIKKEPKEVLEKLKKTRFDGLEILSSKKHELAKPSVRKQFKEQKNGLEYSVHAPYRGINLASDNEKIRKNSIEKIIELMDHTKEIGAKHITIHPGHYSNKKPGIKKRAWEKNRISLQEIAKKAEEKQIKIGLENLPNTRGVLGKTSFEINGLIESIGNNYLNISMDVGHANTTDQIQQFLENKENIDHIHLHDNLGKKDTHETIGEGEIDFKEILQKTTSYKGIYVIESHNLNEAKKSLKRLNEKIKPLTSSY